MKTFKNVLAHSSLIFLCFLLLSCDKMVKVNDESIETTLSKRKIILPDDLISLQEMEDDVTTMIEDFETIVYSLSGPTIEQTAAMDLSSLNYDLLSTYDVNNGNGLNTIILSEKSLINDIVSNHENDYLHAEIVSILYQDSYYDVIDDLVLEFQSLLPSQYNSYDFCLQLAEMSYYLSIGQYESFVLSANSNCACNYNLFSDEEILLLSCIDNMYRLCQTYYYEEQNNFMIMNGTESISRSTNDDCYDEFIDGLKGIAGWAVADAVAIGMGFAATSLGTFGLGAPVAAIASFISAGIVSIKIISDVYTLYSAYADCIESNPLLNVIDFIDISYLDYIENRCITYEIMSDAIDLFIAI